MTEDDRDTAGHPSRREAIAYGGVVVGGGLLTGCVTSEAPDGGDDASADGSGGGPRTDRTGSDDGRADTHEACIEPVGCLTLEEVPETYIVNNGEWADMAFALGQREGFQTATNAIPPFLFEPFGLDVPPEDEATSLNTTSWDREVFYEYDPDVILMDPNYMHATGWDDSWDASDTEEIRENVAPFFGNNVLRRREWHDYRLYSLYEAFDRLADLFRERERFEALAGIHEDVQATVQSRLPPADRRPDVGLLNSASNPTEGTFYPMDTRAEGVETKPYRDLDVGSAFADETVATGTIDYEGLLEVDPEILVVHWGVGVTGDGLGFSPETFRDRYVAPMAEHPVGSQLTAVRTDAVYPGAFGSQGPLVNLLQTELVARQLYPDAFGAFDPERFPDVPAEDRLFDRDEVAAIVRGDG